jgi:hypothetical protein
MMSFDDTLLCDSAPNVDVIRYNLDMQIGLTNDSVCMEFACILELKGHL